MTLLGMVSVPASSVQWLEFVQNIEGGVTNNY